MTEDPFKGEDFWRENESVVVQILTQEQALAILNKGRLEPSMGIDMRRTYEKTTTLSPMPRSAENAFISISKKELTDLGIPPDSLIQWELDKEGSRGIITRIDPALVAYGKRKSEFNDDGIDWRYLFDVGKLLEVAYERDPEAANPWLQQHGLVGDGPQSGVPTELPTTERRLNPGQVLRILQEVKRPGKPPER